MKKLITILAISLASLLHAEDSFAFMNDSLAVKEDVSFSHFAVFLEGGEIYPMGDLQDAVKNTLYGGVGVRYTYWDNVDGIVMFQYAYFKPRPKIGYDGVHQFMGRVGADWSFSRWCSVRALLATGPVLMQKILIGWIVVALWPITKLNLAGMQELVCRYSSLKNTAPGSI